MEIKYFPENTQIFATCTNETEVSFPIFYTYTYKKGSVDDS